MLSKYMQEKIMGRASLIKGTLYDFSRDFVSRTCIYSENAKTCAEATPQDPVDGPDNENAGWHAIQMQWRRWEKGKQTQVEPLLVPSSMDQPDNSHQTSSSNAMLGWLSLGRTKDGTVN